METKQTAVQWLFKNARLNMSVYDWLLCIEHAEEMEREQIIDAWVCNRPQFKDEAEQYYNEQYGK